MWPPVRRRRQHRRERGSKSSKRARENNGPADDFLENVVVADRVQLAVLRGDGSGEATAFLHVLLRAVRVVEAALIHGAVRARGQQRLVVARPEQRADRAGVPAKDVQRLARVRAKDLHRATMRSREEVAAVRKGELAALLDGELADGLDGVEKHRAELEAVCETDEQIEA